MKTHTKIEYTLIWWPGCHISRDRHRTRNEKVAQRDESGTYLAVKRTDLSGKGVTKWGRAVKQREGREESKKLKTHRLP